MKAFIAKHHIYIAGAIFVGGGLLLYLMIYLFGDINEPPDKYGYFAMLVVCVVPVALWLWGESLAGGLRKEQIMAIANRMGLPFLPEFFWEWTEVPLTPEEREVVTSEEGAGALDRIIAFKDSVRINRESAQIFNVGRSPGPDNIIYTSAEDGLLAVFDYTFETGVEHQTRYYNHTVALFANTKGEYPAFALIPEGTFGKRDESFDSNEILFSEDSEFSDKWILRVEQEQSVRDFFDPGMRAYTSALDDIHVEASGRSIFVYTPMLRDDMEDFIQTAKTVHSTFSDRLDAMQ
ncbi:hypothetical protein ACFLZI_03605 [Nitrospirota bacterium]